MAGHSRWRTLQAKRLAETGDVREHPEYERAGRDLRLGDQLRAIRRSRNLTQKEVAERAGISQPALSRIELGGGVPDIETLRRLGNAMGVRFHVIVGNEEADHDENLLVSLAKPRLAGTSTEASHHAPQRFSIRQLRAGQAVVTPITPACVGAGASSATSAPVSHPIAPTESNGGSRPGSQAGSHQRTTQGNTGHIGRSI